MTKIAQFAEYGDADVLRVVDVPAPTAGRVQAAGVIPSTQKGQGVSWV
jgi:hypothetical protein